MLPTPAEFPHVGSTAWLRPTPDNPGAHQCRIIRANHDGTRLIALVAKDGGRQPFQPGPSSGAATGNREVAQDALCATMAEALTPTRPDVIAGKSRPVRQPDFNRLGLGDPSERN